MKISSTNPILNLDAWYEHVFKFNVTLKLHLGKYLTCLVPQFPSLRKENKYLYNLILLQGLNRKHLVNLLSKAYFYESVFTIYQCFWNLFWLVPMIISTYYILFPIHKHVNTQKHMQFHTPVTHKWTLRSFTLYVEHLMFTLHAVQYYAALCYFCHSQLPYFHFKILAIDSLNQFHNWLKFPWNVVINIAVI